MSVIISISINEINGESYIEEETMKKMKMANRENENNVNSKMKHENNNEK